MGTGGTSGTLDPFGAVSGLSQTAITCGQLMHIPKNHGQPTIGVVDFVRWLQPRLCSHLS